MRKEQPSRTAQIKVISHVRVWHVWAKAIWLELQELWPERRVGTTWERPARARSNLIPMPMGDLAKSQVL